MLDGIHDWPLFIAAGLLLNITPGADMALIASRAASQGWRAGAAAALGVGAGCGVHIAAAALGLSALLAGSATAFTLLRWVGAAYLVWLGVAMLRTRAAPASSPLPASSTAAASSTAPAAPALPALPDGHVATLAPTAAAAGAPPPAFRTVFAQGFLTNALNPKVALFFLAFVPQFIAADAPHKAAAFVALGAVFVLNGTLVNLGLAWTVATLRARLAQRPGAARAGLWVNRGVGALFVALGLKLALGDPAARG
ncbi:LysE family translocator [Aquabacterium sp. OR-4]|uniref:LysE family translocator n=1 Tax=Aquabacterium sp. OR-4 TaxID=2978127 RepID=UPI0028C57F79|nr:LysE family translocator [Aquabacterium sp. OR-4]MDT7834912.1 LysE family translocator [Aquabacterium sp. OR-4]